MFCRQWGATESSEGRGRNIAEQAERKLQVRNGGQETTGGAGAELCTQRGDSVVSQKAGSLWGTSLGGIFLLPGRWGLICEMASWQCHHLAGVL